MRHVSFVRGSLLGKRQTHIPKGTSENLKQCHGLSSPAALFGFSGTGSILAPDWWYSICQGHRFVQKVTNVHALLPGSSSRSEFVAKLRGAPLKRLVLPFDLPFNQPSTPPKKAHAALIEYRTEDSGRQTPTKTRRNRASGASIRFAGSCGLTEPRSHRTPSEGHSGGVRCRCCFFA